MPSWGGGGRCLVDSLLPPTQLGSQPAATGSIPANSPGPHPGVQDLRERLLEKLGPLPSYQSSSSLPERTGRLRPRRSFLIPQSLTFRTVSASLGFSPASFQEEIRPPPFIRTPLPSARPPTPTLPFLPAPWWGGEEWRALVQVQKGMGSRGRRWESSSRVVGQEAGRWVQGWSGWRAQA